MANRLRGWQRLLVGLGAPGIGLLGLAYLRRGGRGLVCVFHRLTGLYCPGCGSGRALSALWQGDIRGAFAWHPLLLPLGLPALAVMVHEYIRLVFPRAGLRPVRVPPWLAGGCGVLVAAFWLLRNLPAFSFLAPIGG